jgi:hypothetical protein
MTRADELALIDRFIAEHGVVRITLEDVCLYNAMAGQPSAAKVKAQHNRMVRGILNKRNKRRGKKV